MFKKTASFLMKQSGIQESLGNTTVPLNWH